MTSIVPGTAAANLGKAEDTAHNSGDVGVMSLAVRNDTLAALGGSDGDYTPLQVNADGAVYVTDAVSNRISTTSFNSRDAATLAASATFQGVGEDVLAYARAGISIVSDNVTDGTLTIEVSQDNSTWKASTRTISNTTNGEPHMWNIVEQYFRIKYVNGSTEATNLAIQVQYSNNSNILLGRQLNQTLLDESEGIIVRSINVGKTDGGTYKNVPVSIEGHLKTAISSPINPFGSIHTENIIPIFQIDGVYGINPTTIISRVGHFTDGSSSGTNIGINTAFKCSTGTTALSFASIESRKRLRYRSGQGIIGRFAGLFSAPTANSTIIAGFGTGESGFYYGYNGTTFGILHSTDGVREIQTLEITTASSATDDIQITLPSTSSARTFTVTNITNASGSKELTAYQISKGTFTGWKAEQRGVYVIFLRDDVGVLTGTPLVAQSGAATPTAGTYVETLSGVASTDTWIAQSSWNGDVCDGTGLSGFNLDHTKGNVFQIAIAWLGYGPVKFSVITPNSNGTDTGWITVHVIANPNTRTTPHTTNPSFPFKMGAYSTGSTTDVSISISSFAGFVEGEKKLTGPRSSFSGTSTAVSTGSYYTIFSIRNDYIYGNTGITERANQTIVNILSFGGAHDDATPIQFYLLRNATLIGTPDWTKWSVGSCIYWDTDATTATITDNNQIIQVIPVGQHGTLIMPLEDTTTLEPGETLTVAATAVSGTSTYTIATLNTREDQ